MCKNLRRHERKLSPARRSSDLPHARSHGAAVGDARNARRWPGELWVHRRRSTGSDALHRSAHDASRRCAHDRHGEGHRRFRPQLRRNADRADGFPSCIPQPARQRRDRHRRRHGHQYSAAQFNRSDRRYLRTDRYPEITLDELMKHVKGPDFPTGCVICGVGGIRQYFETGRGSMKVRGQAGVEELKGGREQIVITEIPYGVNRATLVERIAQLVNEKVLTDISYVGDQSDENTRVVIELKRDANPKVIIANLYKHTALETSFAVIMLAIDHGRPKLLALK